VGDEVEFESWGDEGGETLDGGEFRATEAVHEEVFFEFGREVVESGEEGRERVEHSEFLSCSSGRLRI